MYDNTAITTNSVKNQYGPKNNDKLFKNIHKAS